MSMKKTARYNKDHPSKDQYLSNLSKDEKDGVKSLIKRTSNNGEVVFTSDKSKKRSTGAVCKVKCTEASGSTGM